MGETRLAPVDLAGLAVGGISVGGVETCIEVPTWKLAVDIGRCPPSAIGRPTVLFTHAHMDHMGGVAMHAATRSLRHQSAPRYVVPRENEAAFGALFDAWRALDGSDLPYTATFLGPGEEIELSPALVARTFRSPHRAPCQGYAFYQVKRKLLPRYRGLPQEEIARLRKVQGREVTRRIESCELVITGDTRADVLERVEAVGTARRLVMEVTFLDDRISPAEAQKMGHTHLYDIAERAELLRNEAILFTHFSARYSAREIIQALDERLPADLRERVTPLLTGWAADD